MSAQTLAVFDPDGISRVLCVVAHPDDMEYGMSAVVARWVAEGIDVAYLLLTSGEAGMQIPPEQVGPLRAAEQRSACDVVGVRELTILDHPDGTLMPGLDLRRDIARQIRRFRPDAVLTMTWELETSWGLNQADHRAVGVATLDGCRDADNTWVFPELATDEELPKWGVQWLLVGGHSAPTHAVDISGEPLAKGVASLAAHRQYLAALPEHPAPEDFIPARTAETGTALGVAHAVAFRAYQLSGPTMPEDD